MKAVLALAGFSNIAQGIGCLFFYKPMFAALQTDAQSFSLFVQLSGVLLIALGAGLWLVMRNPTGYRRLLPVICAVLAVASVLAMNKITRGKLPADFLPFIVGGQILLLPFLGLVAKKLFSDKTQTG